MRSPAIDWRVIESFVGFGPSNAPNIFIGMEEGLEDDIDLEFDLRVRSTYAPYMDLLRAQSELGAASKYVGSHAICQKTWRPMADLMLRLEGKTPTLEGRNLYQGERLGRIPGQTLLCELLPYPRKNTKGRDWEYRAFNRFESFADYRDALLDDRINLLRNAIHAHPRKLIVCYGKKYWADYERLVRVERWERHGRFQYGKAGHTAVVMGWHLSGRAFNSDDQLAEFYRIVTEALALE
jgi:hypothetical protein